MKIGMRIAATAAVTMAATMSLMTFGTSALAGTEKEGDRLEFEKDIIGVVNTNNFEYTCIVDIEYGSDKVKVKAFVDTDFSEAPGYRLAVGFVGGGSYKGVVAAESPVLSVTKARCPGLCLSMTIKADNAGSTSTVDFNEDPVSKVITISETIGTDTNTLGTCTKN